MKYFIDDVEVEETIYREKLWGECAKQVAAEQNPDDYDKWTPYEKGLYKNFATKSLFEQYSSINEIELNFTKYRKEE